MPFGSGSSVGTAYVRLIVTGDDLDTQIKQKLKDAEPGINKSGQDAGKQYSDGFGKGFDDSVVNNIAENIKKLGKETRTTTRDTDRFADSIGRIFGKGARNDFLNILGGVVGGFTRLGSAIGSLAVGPLNRILNETLSRFTGIANVLTKGGGASFGGVAGLVGAVYLLAEGFQSVVAFGSGVVGIGTALAASFTYALAGTITAVGGSLFYFASGLGVAALAIANLSDDQKQKLKGITDAWSDLGDTAAKAFGPALIRNAEKIETFIRRDLNPIVRTLGKSMGRVLDDFTESLNGPAWQRFLNTFQKRAPSIVENLGNTFTNLGEVIAGVLRAATPTIDRFSQDIEDATQKLSDWVNSTEGQNKLKKFFDDSYESAKKWKDLIGEAGEAIGNLFFDSKDTGDSIIERLTGQLEDFNEWITSPEGSAAMDEWLIWAEDLAVKLGETADSVTRLTDALDNADSRTDTGNILDFINSIDNALGKLRSAREWITNNLDLGKIFQGQVIDWKGIYGGIEDANDWLGQKIRAAGRKIAGWFGEVDWSKIIPNPTQRVRDQVSGLGTKISTWAGRIDWSKVFGNPWTDYVWDKVKGLATKIGTAIGKVDWSQIFKDPWDSIKGFFTGLATKIKNAIGSITLKPSIDWPDPPGWLSKITPGLAAGGIVTSPGMRLIGEAGPEAVVPLNRPLGLVDPAVRELSAIAQGLTPPPLRTQGKTQDQPTMVNNWNIMSPGDPVTVSYEVLNRLTAAGY